MHSDHVAYWRKYGLGILLSVILFGLVALQMARPINLAAVDIGRHVKNGELILQGQTQVLHTNYYSFTHPDYPFINHHWFFGVCSYLIWKCGGFNGLSIAYIAVVLGALFFFFRAALLRGHFPLTILFGFIALPLLFDRREIRPEGVSILFMGLYFYLLTKLSLGEVRKGLAYLILIVIQIVWVNTHIFFFMGPLLIAFFMWEGKNRGCGVCVRSLIPLLFISIAVNILNPSGLAGALTPLNIFKGFGYRLVENQNIFFMMSFFPDHKNYPYYLACVGILGAGMIAAVWARGWKLSVPFIVLAIFVAAAGMKAIRLMSPFGFFLVALGPFFYSKLLGRLNQRTQKIINAALLCAACVLAVAQLVNLKNAAIGTGLAPGADTSAQFFKREGIKGPVFSNYDIGGFLIFYLAPQEKVFVDNRQEAFPPSFFKDVYIPMQESDEEWAKAEAQYAFNAIYFYRHDLTPWGQTFLIKRVEDPAWAPVFVDDYTIIFLKRTPQNAPLINQFELPKSIFSVKKG